MPYYVYKIENFPVKLLEKLAEFDAFKAASTEAKARRANIDPTSGQVIKVIFAETELEAEDLLSQVREAPPKTGEDY